MTRGQRATRFLKINRFQLLTNHPRWFFTQYLPPVLLFPVSPSFLSFLPFPFSPLSFSYLLSKLVDHWDHNGKLVLVYSLVYDFSTLKSYRHGKLNKFKIYYYYYDFFAHTYSISCLSLLVKNIIIYPTT